MASFVTIVGSLFTTAPAGAYRPAIWSKPQLTSLTCTLPSSSTGSSIAGRTNTSPGPTTYFFDAVMRVEHNQELVATEHPVQVGPAVVDHAYLRPSRVVLEVNMSDAMASFRTGQYSSNHSKSVSAFQTFLQIQSARVPITLATRLKSYQNMVIEDVRAMDDSRTPHALRCIIYLRQIISANVSTSSVSVRPDQTGATNEGTKAPAPVDPTSALHNQLLQDVPPPQ